MRQSVCHYGMRERTTQPATATNNQSLNNTTTDTLPVPSLFFCFNFTPTMAYLLPHLHSGWEVDQAILTEEDRVVVIRFGRDNDPTCMIQDEVLMSIAEKVKNFAVIYLVDIDEVPDFNAMVGVK